MKKKLSFFIALCFVLIGVTTIGLGFSTSNVKAAETVNAIKPMAWYEFNDAKNPGLDSQGNYNLKVVNSASKDALQIKEDGTDKYLSLTSVRDAEGAGGKAGACLYAPQLDQSGKDFSDIIDYSYSVEITFRRDNSKWIGDHYLLVAGKYNNAFQITPWKGNIEIQVLNKKNAVGATDQEKQQYLEKNTILIQHDTSVWTTVLVSVSHVTKEAVVYINGVENTRLALPSVYFSYRDEPYTFSLGAQCQMNGGAATMFATADIKDCKVFDYAVSDLNAKDLFDKKESSFVGKYVKSIGAIDATKLDLLVTDTNTLDKIMRETLPQKVEITLSDNSTMKSDVFWFSKGAQIQGYLKSQIPNINQLYLSQNYGYTVNFDYNSDAARVSNIKLDGAAYVPNTPIDSNIHVVTFKVAAQDGYKVNSVMWSEMEQDCDASGVYEISFNGGANVIIDATKETFLVTYYDGESKLGTSNYTASGSEELKSFKKDGYNFVGWYLDKELTNKVTALNYDAPTNITLYAKYDKIVIEDTKSGCGSLLFGGGSAAFVLALLGMTFIVIKKRKANKI